MSESKQDETFKVVDRRLFNEEGEFRKDIAEQQDRERETVPAPTAQQKSAVGAPGAKSGAPAISGGAQGVAAPVPEPAKDAPKRLQGFENLTRWMGQNAAMLLGGYADPRTGQPMLDLEGAREMIDMLDALREKTIGNLAPEEDQLILDILGNLKLAFMEMTKAAAAASAPGKVKSRT